MLATILLIILCSIATILVYVFALIFRIPPNLIMIKLSTSPDILHGELYRLVTYMFIHGGLIHLLFNMYALFVLGTLLERYLRSRKLFLCTYFICGIIAGLSPILWLPYEVVYSIGSSGAIFGLVGTIVMLPIRRLILNPWNILALILINIIGLIPGSRIDVIGHVLGFITGVVIGYVISKRRFRRPRYIPIYIT